MIYQVFIWNIEKYPAPSIRFHDIKHPEKIFSQSDFKCAKEPKVASIVAPQNLFSTDADVKTLKIGSFYAVIV